MGRQLSLQNRVSGSQVLLLELLLVLLLGCSSLGGPGSSGGTDSTDGDDASTRSDASPTPTSPTPVSPTPTSPTPSPTAFSLVSSAFVSGGTLPTQSICAEKSGLDSDTNPPLSFSGAPEGTVEFALLMSTQAKDENGDPIRKYNWVLYSIPATASAVPEENTVITSGYSGISQVGVAGLTSDGPYYDYSPPCSQGSGLKSYTFTLYALSEAPVFTPNTTPGTGGDGASLEASLTGITLGTASMIGTYTFP